MFRLHPIAFFIVTLALFSGAALFGLWLQTWKDGDLKPEEFSVKTLLGASLGLFGVLLGFTFSMANSRFEERRQLEITEGSGLEIVWLRTSFLAEPARSTERSLLRRYVPVRIGFFDAGPDLRGYEEILRESTSLQKQMWRVASDEVTAHRDPPTVQFLAALGDSVQATEKRTAAAENRIPALSWAILLLLGMMASVLLGADLRSRSYLLRGMLQVALAAALALTYDIDTPSKGFVQVGQQSMLRAQQLIDSTPVD
jgi:hypothetical protein